MDGYPNPVARPGAGLRKTEAMLIVHIPECWQLLTRWPRTQASQANFSPSTIILTKGVEKKKLESEELSGGSQCTYDEARDVIQADPVIHQELPGKAAGIS